MDLRDKGWHPISTTYDILNRSYEFGQPEGRAVSIPSEPWKEEKGRKSGWLQKEALEKLYPRRGAAGIFVSLLTSLITCDGFLFMPYLASSSKDFFHDQNLLDMYFHGERVSYVPADRTTLVT